MISYFLFRVQSYGLFPKKAKKVTFIGVEHR